MEKYSPTEENVAWASKDITDGVCKGVCVLVLQQKIIDVGFVDFSVVPMSGDKVFLHI